MVLSIIFLEGKHTILLHLSIFYEYEQFCQHRICFSIQSQLQLVNLHRNRRYFVIKLHTWFCLSYFLKTNIKLYCMSVKSSTELMLYVVLAMPTLNKAYLFIYLFIIYLLHLSIFYEYHQQFFQHRICFSIQPPDYSDP